MKGAGTKLLQTPVGEKTGYRTRRDRVYAEYATKRMGRGERRDIGNATEV